MIVGHSFCRRTRGSISPCNIAGLFSNVSEEVATEIAKNRRRRQPHCHLTPPPRGTPENICISLIFSVTRIIGLHFCRWQYGSVFIRTAVVASQMSDLTQRSVTICTYCSSRSSKVIDFGTNRKRTYDFLLVVNRTMVFPCTVSEIRRPPRSTRVRSSAASDVYKRQGHRFWYQWKAHIRVPISH